MSQQKNFEGQQNPIQQEDILPELQDAQNFLSLCVLSIPSADYQITLPDTLKAAKSIYFDNILFIIVGHIPDSILPDLINHNQRDDQCFLPENICYTKSNLPCVVSMIGAFLLRGQSKVLLFGQDLKNIYDQLSFTFQSEIKDERFAIFEIEKFAIAKETDLISLSGQHQTPDEKERKIIREVLRKLLKMIQTNPDQVPKDLMKFSQSTMNFIKGQIDSEKIKCEDNKLAERLTFLTLYEFCACNTFKNQVVQRQIILGQIKDLKDLEQLYQTQLDLQVFKGKNFEESKSSNSNIKDQSMLSDSKNNSLLDISQSNILNTSALSIKSTQSTQNQQITQQQQQQQIYQQQQQFNQQQQIIQGQQQQTPLYQQQVYQQQQQQQPREQQVQQQIQQLNILSQTNSNTPDEIEDLNQPIFNTQVSDTVRIFFSNFKSANIANIKKLNSLINTVSNLSKNEITRKMKNRTTLPDHKRFYNQFETTPKLNSLVIYNLLKYLYTNQLIRFDSTSVLYDSIKIENEGDQYVQEGRIQVSSYSLADAEVFEKDPKKIITQDQNNIMRESVQSLSAFMSMEGRLTKLVNPFNNPEQSAVYQSQELFQKSVSLQNRSMSNPQIQQMSVQQLPFQATESSIMNNTNNILQSSQFNQNQLSNSFLQSQQFQQNQILQQQQQQPNMFQQQQPNQYQQPMIIVADPSMLQQLLRQNPTMQFPNQQQQFNPMGGGNSFQQPFTPMSFNGGGFMQQYGQQQQQPFGSGNSSGSGSNNNSQNYGNNQ